MARKKDQRRKAVVNVSVQWTLATRVVMHFCLFICAGFLFGLIFQYLSNPLGSLSDHVGNFWNQSAPMLVAMVCMLPVFVRDTLTLSNRIVGPICRLRDTVRRLGEGEDTPPLKFRNKDMWDDLPALFNTMVTRLKQPEFETVVTELKQTEASAETDASGHADEDTVSNDSNSPNLARV